MGRWIQKLQQSSYAMSIVNRMKKMQPKQALHLEGLIGCAGIVMVTGVSP